VEEGSNAERVEIELTSRDYRRDGRHRRRRDTDVLDPLGGSPAAPGDAERVDIAPGEHGDATFAPPLTPSEGPLSSERARLVVTAVVAGAIALFVGWSFGRAGDGGGSQADELETGSTTLTTTVPPDEVGATIAPVDLSLLPTSLSPTTSSFTPIVGTARPVSTTTTPDGWVTSTARVAPQAAELGVRIVGLHPNGTVVELDTTSGELASIRVGVRTNYQGGLYAGADWILVGQPDSAGATLFRGHGDPELLTLAQPWLLHWQPGTDRFWRLDETVRFGDPLHIVEITYDGTPTGVAFDADGRYWIPGADPLGGLLVLGAPGGSYHIAPEGTSRITTGDVIALNANTVLASDCGEAMEHCGLIVIDRASGATTPLVPTVLEPTTDSAPIEYFDSPAGYGYPSLLSAISPDGRYSPIMVANVDQDYGVIDMTTGEFIQFGDVPESSLWWSPDSRSAMYLVNGHLTVYDFDTRTTYEVSTDVFPLQEFVVRPQAQ
jgi:hypothetical protein